MRSAFSAQKTLLKLMFAIHARFELSMISVNRGFVEITMTAKRMKSGSVETFMAGMMLQAISIRFSDNRDNRKEIAYEIRS